MIFIVIASSLQVAEDLAAAVRQRRLKKSTEA